MSVPSVGPQDLRASLPDTVSTLRVNGLSNPIEIIRDAHGIPHIKAHSSDDAFFGQGFVAAQDRLWQMDRDRRRALGRWSEWVGEKGLIEDRTMRRFQLGPAARTDYATINTSAQSMLKAYVSGINSFIESTNALPIEYDLLGCKPEIWEPWECLAIFKVRHIFMVTFEAKLWRARFVNQLGPELTSKLWHGYPQGNLLINPPGSLYQGPVLDGIEELRRSVKTIEWLKGEDAGSNNWVLSGDRTASGKPLMAGDPHRALDVPNAYYQNHISCPEFDVVGLSFAGCPGYPHFGHNKNVAWCVTHGSADYQDLFLERFNPDDTQYYEFQGRWERADVKHETITVRDSKPEDLFVTITHHGPIILGDPQQGNAIAFRYTATADPNATFEPVRDALTAKSVDDLERSMSGWVEPCNNLLSADIDGNISYLFRGKLPLRSMDNAWVPVPGWTGDHDWKGYVPFNEQLRSRNPKLGCIVTANNRIADNDYPHYISLDYSQPYRAQRVFDRLCQLKGKATTNDMISIHSDRISIPAQAYVKLLSNLEVTDPLSIQAQTHLIHWDGSMDKDSTAAAIYSSFRERLHRFILENLLEKSSNDLFDDTTRGSQAFFAQFSVLLVDMALKNDTSLLPPKTSWPIVLRRALDEGVINLKNRLGDDTKTWKWGELHATNPKHPLAQFFPQLSQLLNPATIPMGGDGDTPQQGNFSRTDPFTVTSLSVARYVFDLSDWNNSGWIVPLGVSGHPGSSHYQDQASTWGTLELIPMLYDWDKITDQAESSQLLKPA